MASATLWRVAPALHPATSRARPRGGGVDRAHDRDAFGLGQRVVLAGRAAGDDAAHASTKHALDDGGQAVEIKVTTGVERRHDGDIDAFQREVHERTVLLVRSRSDGTSTPPNEGRLSGAGGPRDQLSASRRWGRRQGRLSIASQPARFGPRLHRVPGAPVPVIPVGDLLPASPSRGPDS